MSTLSLLGIPNDDNSSALQGAAAAPPCIRRELYSDAYSAWTETGFDLGVPGRIVDHGDLRFDGGADAWDVIEQGVARVLADGAPLICLGGDHAVTHPILRALRPRQPRLSIVHIDAHADIYDAYQGNPRSHASPFARILEQGLADRLIQIGLRTVNDHQREQFRRFGVEVVEMRQFDAALNLDLQTPVYLSVDMDGLDPAFAPGVSHREPGGLSTRQVIALIQSITPPLVGADVVEYNPRCDVAGMTATVAAKLVKEIAGVMLRNAA